LEAFDFVLLTESMNDQLVPVLKWMGLSTDVERRRVAEDKAFLDLSDDEILAANQEDLALYEACNRPTSFDNGILNPLKYNAEHRIETIRRIRRQVTEDHILHNMHTRIAMGLCKEYWAVGALEWLDKKPDHIKNPDALRRYVIEAWEEAKPELNEEQIDLVQQKSKRLRMKIKSIESSKE
ncbi:MAG: hypothetical protein AAFX52_12630, partial [Pseudomonadota bacterium]